MTGGAARRTERLMCLVFILKARGRRGITRAELRDTVEDYARCPNNLAYERMLERDKHDLRDVGIIVDVVQRDAWHEDEFAYVLGAGSMLTLPPLEPEELRVLALAADAWERGTWDAAAQGALHKLEVFGADLAPDNEARISMRADEHVATLRDAIRSRHAVRFDYRKPGDAASAPRGLEPWGLVYRHGGWYCVGFDLDRKAARVFRTSRITSRVTMTGEASADVDPSWPSLPIATDEALTTVTASLLIAPDRGWRWRNQGVLTGTRDLAGLTHDIVSVDLPDTASTIAALATAAPAVLVLEPMSMRDQVIRHLEEVAHG